jgi:hypothetical protein
MIHLHPVFIFDLWACRRRQKLKLRRALLLK